MFNQKANLVTTNYIVVETLALLQNRLGLDCVRDFIEILLPLIKVTWVDEKVHRAGLHALLTASKSNLSFVDCISFEIMRELGIRVAFTFDKHFKQQGFKCLPE